MADSTAITHFAYAQKDGQAEVAQVT